MAENNQDTAPIEEILLSQVYTMQALINVLERKGLVTREEILEAFEAIKDIMEDECDCGEDHLH
ncbi:MAG TPA: hypothetical protein VHY08_05880 [Bacillota bacterium]|nr:hypothetical protein [Bacillota bacterium]